MNWRARAEYQWQMYMNAEHLLLSSILEQCSTQFSNASSRRNTDVPLTLQIWKYAQENQDLARELTYLITVKYFLPVNESRTLNRDILS